jgi:tetratricopeptide (TPR) repeat protein
MKALVVVLLSLACCFGGSARADATAEARAHYRHGLSLFNEGQFDEARAEFEAGYSIQPLPLFLFNAAQSARRGNDRARALELYRRFVAADPDSSLRAEAEQYIADLGPFEPRPSASPPEPAETRAPSVVRSYSQPPSPRGRWARDATGGVLAGIGIAAAIAGATLTGIAGARLNGAGTNYDTFDTAHRTTPLFISGGVVLGAGTVFLVGSAIRYSLVARRPSAAR